MGKRRRKKKERNIVFTKEKMEEAKRKQANGGSGQVKKKKGLSELMNELLRKRPKTVKYLQKSCLISKILTAHDVTIQM